MLFSFTYTAVGEDFILLRSEVTFDIGANDGNTINVLVDVLDDLLVEGTECFTLTGGIGSPAAPGSSFVGGPVTVCILDNDGKTCIWLYLQFSSLFLSLVFLPSNSGTVHSVFDYFLQPKNWTVGRPWNETKVYICKWAIYHVHIYFSTCSGHAWCQLCLTPYN